MERPLKALCQVARASPEGLSASDDSAESSLRADRAGSPGASRYDFICTNRVSMGKGVNIVCIGWGSLVWEPGVLRCIGDWQADGPHLPLEFARTSRDGRLTLVLTPEAVPVPTLWCKLDYNTGEAAQAALAGREGTSLHAIGLWPGSPPHFAVGAAEIAVWCKERGVDAVIWTALRPKFESVDGAGPIDAEAAAAYLGSLDESARARAREYVQRAPKQVSTSFRPTLELALGLRK